MKPAQWARIAVLVPLGACAPEPPRAPALPERSYTCVLRPLATLGPDFTARQHVEASSHGRSGSFDAVLQKKGDTLVLVGLVAGVRAFVLKEEGERISFEQSLGPRMPFPPEYAVIDIHRVYWKHLPRGADAPPTGVLEGELDGESVREVWSNGNLVERRFSRPGEFQGVVRIEYGAGCTAARCLPVSVRIENEWFGYAVRIDNREITLL
jgi:Protein of unknown function (DUF3261)